jgi:predicted small lipoprotein YifL
MFEIRFPTLVPLALLAVFSLAACGGKPPPGAADTAPQAAAEKEEPAAEPVATQTVGSRQACELLDPSDVELILGSLPKPAPRLEAQTAGVAMAACAWELAPEGGEVVVEGEGVATSELEGEAADGVGDAAVLRLRGDNRVKVLARVGGRMMTLEATGPAMVERKGVVITAARGTAERLRSIPETAQ